MTHSIPGSRNVGARAAPGGFESRLEREAELAAELAGTDEHDAAAELAQEAQHGEVAVGLDGVPHDGAEPLECLAVGGEVAEDLRLAVQEDLQLAVQVEGLRAAAAIASSGRTPSQYRYPPWPSVAAAPA